MFNLPNLFTAANMLSGVVAIVLALGGRLELAPFAVFLGMIFDFFDGFLARKLGVSGEMGKQMDSLADMVTFGVAPAVMMLVVITQYHYSHIFMSNTMDMIFHGESYSMWSYSIWLNDLLNGDNVFVTPLVVLLIPFFSIFRLAKFNLDKRQTDGFYGLPTPANALFYMSFPLVLCYQQPGFAAGGNPVEQFLFEWAFHPAVLLFVIPALSILMVLDVRLFSLKFKTFDWKNNRIRYVFLLISLGLIIFFKAWALALIVFLYLILSLIENNILKKGKNEI